MPDAMLEKRFNRSNGFVTRAIADETLIVPVSKQVANLTSIYTLNEVASLIWQNLNGQTSVKQLIEIIATEFEVSNSTAADDVYEFLEELSQAGLIQPVQE